MLRRLFTAAAVVSLLVTVAAGSMAATDVSYRFSRSIWVLGSHQLEVSWHRPMPSFTWVDDPNGDLAPARLKAAYASAGPGRPLFRQQTDRLVRAGPFTAYFDRLVGA